MNVTCVMKKSIFRSVLFHPSRSYSALTVQKTPQKFQNSSVCFSLFNGIASQIARQRTNNNEFLSGQENFLHTLFHLRFMTFSSLLWIILCSSADDIQGDSFMHSSVRLSVLSGIPWIEIATKYSADIFKLEQLDSWVLFVVAIG